MTKTHSQVKKNKYTKKQKIFMEYKNKKTKGFKQTYKAIYIEYIKYKTNCKTRLNKLKTLQVLKILVYKKKLYSDSIFRTYQNCILEIIIQQLKNLRNLNGWN